MACLQIVQTMNTINFQDQMGLLKFQIQIQIMALVLLRTTQVTIVSWQKTTQNFPLPRIKVNSNRLCIWTCLYEPRAFLTPALSVEVRGEFVSHETMSKLHATKTDSFNELHYQRVDTIKREMFSQKSVRRFVGDSSAFVMGAMFLASALNRGISPRY